MAMGAALTRMAAAAKKFDADSVREATSPWWRRSPATTSCELPTRWSLFPIGVGVDEALHAKPAA